MLNEKQLPRPAVSVPVLRRAISDSRWSSYQEHEGTNVETLARYMWSTALSTALQPAFHALEVTLRNTLHDRATELLGSRQLVYVDVPTWLDARPRLLLARDYQEVLAVKERLRRRKKLFTENCLVADLSFGFWTALFDRKYEHGRLDGPALWPRLAKSAFPYAPKDRRDRASLSELFHGLRQFRNRLAHHEPIHRRRPLQIHSAACSAIGWMNPSAAHVLKFATSGRVEILVTAGPNLFRDAAEELVAAHVDA